MAIINPSLVFEGSHLGDRYDPDPGDYTARLIDVMFTNDGNHIQMSWRLTNHPLKVYNWIVQRTYTLQPQHIGFLNKDMWAWKRKYWEQLGEDNDERLDATRMWIEHEANTRVTAWNTENPRLVSVAAIWSLGMSGPSSWRGRDEETD